MNKNKFFLLIAIALSCSSCRRSIEELELDAKRLDNQKKYEDAIQIYGEILKRDPNNIDAYLNRGIDKGLLGDKEGEITDLRAIIRIDSTNTLVYFNLGISLGNLNRYSEALASFNLAIKTKGGEFFWHNDVKNALSDDYLYDCSMEEIIMERGVVYLRADSLRQAYDDFTFCIDRKYRLEESYYLRGLSYLNSGMTFEACGDFHSSSLWGSKAIELILKECKNVSKEKPKVKAEHKQGAIDKPSTVKDELKEMLEAQE